MSQPRRMSLAKQLLRDCSAAYPARGFRPDLDTVQTVEHYNSSDGQLKYTHMYFAKSVSLWRDLRHESSGSGPIYSVGAGPCLCLLGWFWEDPPEEDREVFAIDALEWRHVRNLTSHRQLMDEVIGPNFSYDAGRHIPDLASGRPPEVAVVPSTTPLAPVELAKDSTVLLPFILNHVAGVTSSTPLTDVIGWLQRVAARVAEVFVVDMPHAAAPRFWPRLASELGVTNEPTTRVASSASDFSTVYPSDAKWPTRRTNAKMCRYTALAWRRGAWTFIT